MDKRYQVFVSSTYADLKDERRAVIQTLMEMDCIPAGMELFPAADEEQFSFIKKIIDDCDYYILIIGGRYGSTTSEGLSYTEKEYDYAREKKIHVLAFVHENPGKIPLEKSELDAGLRARLDVFREKVKTGKMVKMWQDAKDLPGLVALSLSKTIKTHPAVGWVRADKVATSEALSDLNKLRKRNDEIERRLKELAPALPELAGLDDLFEISGTHKFDVHSQPHEWHITVSWGEIFAALGPYMLECPNDTQMRAYFNSAVLDLFKSKKLKTYQNWNVRGQDFQTVKLQLMALHLASVEMAETVNGGQALFWSPTDLGRSTLMELRTVKKKS
ncbi:MAG: DUF4062 domain-containing protein [Terracidiphilus sp.]